MLLAERFGMLHTDENGEKAAVYHPQNGLGCYGALAYLIETYAGALPTWMAPGKVRFPRRSRIVLLTTAGSGSQAHRAGLPCDGRYPQRKIGRRSAMRRWKIPICSSSATRDISQAPSPAATADISLGAMTLDAFAAVLRTL